MSFALMIYIVLTSTEAGTNKGSPSFWTHISSSPHSLCALLFSLMSNRSRIF